MNQIRSRTKDPFLLNYNPSELETAAEFLTNWLPFITKDLCRHCTLTISNRIRSLEQQGSSGNVDVEPSQSEECLSSTTHTDVQEDSQDSNDNCDCDTHSLGSWKDGANGWSEPVVDARLTETATTSDWKSVDSQGARLSWADMADELEEEEGLQQGAIRPPSTGACDSTEVGKQVQKKELSREQREYIRFMNVQRKKDFICLERVRGEMVNVLEGIELHCGVFSAAEQKRIVDLVLDLQEKGKNGDLKARTYTAPEPWMRGKGRVTIQFGCCYNYAPDKKGNPPGILRSELVDPIPHLFKVIIRRMVRWHVLPPSCVPDSCIVNIYEEGNCIPPHIDNHDFVRPFCTVSFLSECNIVFGSTLKILGPGDFSGSTAIPLPVGSVLVLQGNGADVAKHCVPAVQSKRISITFRKMDESKRPIEFIPEADLQGIQPLAYDMDESNTSNPSNSPPLVNRQPSDTDESMITYPANSPPPMNRRPVTRESSSERRRGFPGRGSGRGNGSEPRYSATPNRQPSDTNESKIRYTQNSSSQVNRQPFVRESSSERRREFVGRGSESEPRYSTPPNHANRQPFIRESSSERRREFVGRGSESEPRYSTPPNHANRQPVIRDRLPDSGKGILGRGGESEPPRYTNTRQSQDSQQLNRPRVRMSLGT